MKHILLLLMVTLLTACTSTGRYSQHRDSAPKRLPSQISMNDAVPEYIPYSPRGNSSYEVRGKRYHPIQNAQDFSATGEASWYGQKFHGHLTSNGEIYDMYAMSAAHKTLPLPSFVRVTNLDNDKQVIVRVNDRGPFHQNRIIDLSYAAAMKLDMLKTGTAHVKIDVVHVDEDGLVSIAGENINEQQTTELSSPPTPLKVSDDALFIQVAALQDKQKVDQLAKGLAMLFQIPTHVPEEQGVYRLRLGPIDDETHASSLLKQLKENGYEQAYKLYAPH